MVSTPGRARVCSHDLRFSLFNITWTYEAPPEKVLPGSLQSLGEIV